MGVPGHFEWKLERKNKLRVTSRRMAVATRSPILIGSTRHLCLLVRRGGGVADHTGLPCEEEGRDQHHQVNSTSGSQTHWERQTSGSVRDAGSSNRMRLSTHSCSEPSSRVGHRFSCGFGPQGMKTTTTTTTTTTGS